MKQQTQGKIDALFTGIIIGIILIGIVWVITDFTSKASASYKRGFQDGQEECERTVIKYLDNVKNCEYFFYDNNYNELNQTNLFEECLKK